MQYTPTDLRERQQFIDRSIELTRADLADQRIIRQLGARAVDFSSLLNSLEAVTVLDDEVQLPSQNPNALPIVALRPGETVVMHPGYQLQDPVQKQQTKWIFNTWRPKHESAVNRLYAQRIGRTSLAERPQVTLDEATLAMNGYSASCLLAAELQRDFEGAPSKGFALVYGRACILLRMEPGLKALGGGALLHEFAHVLQKRRQPVITLSSQRSADMQALRDESEAYRIGFASSIVHYTTTPISKAHYYDALQVVVEDTRRKFQLDPNDPDRPSGAFLKAIRQLPINVLHGTINFDETAKLFEDHYRHGHYNDILQRTLQHLSLKNSGNAAR